MTTRLKELSPAQVAEAARRVRLRCDELALLSSSTNAIERVYLSREHAHANRLCAGWMRELGMTTWQDAAGNQIGRLSRPGEAAVFDAPTVLIASHLDTVPDAGRFDGIVGVLMGLEVVRLLREMDTDGNASSPLPFAIDVVGYADEEGTRFGKALLGSSAMAGSWDDAWWELSDNEGVTLRRAFVEFGLDPDRVREAARKPEQLVGYLEAHIEQGPELHRTDQPLAVVSSIASARRMQLIVNGEARHAGGTPYDMRRDALLGASEIALAVERICKGEHHIVGTVGQLDTYPGAVNIIPGEVHLSLDLRGELDEARDQVWQSISDAVDEITARRALSWSSLSLIHI